jgi:fucose permease
MSFLGFIMIGVAATLIGPAFAPIMKEFNISLAVLGFLASAWNMGYLLAFIGGIVSDHYGETFVLSISLLVVGSALGFVSIVPNYQTLSGLFLLAGIGVAFAETSTNAVISRLYPNRTGSALNVLHVFYSAGAFIGPALAALLIESYGNWRLPYLVTCICFAPLTVFAAIRTIRGERHTGAASSRARTTYSPGIRLPRILLRGHALMLAGFFYLGAEWGTNAWLASFLILERGFSIALAGLSTGLFWALMAVGRLSLGRLVDKFGFKKMMLCCSSFGALSILAATLVEGRYITVALWAFSGFIFGPMMPTIFAWTSTLFPSRRGLASGAVLSAASLGAVLSPWIIGALADLYGLTISAFYLVFSTLAIGLSVLLLRGEDQHRPTRFVRPHHVGGQDRSGRAEESHSCFHHFSFFGRLERIVACSQG